MYELAHTLFCRQADTHARRRRALRRGKKEASVDAKTLGGRETCKKI